MTLPTDLLILRPWPSTTKPCVSSPLYGGWPYSMQPVSSDEWNQPRCWSEPSRYRSAGQASSAPCEPPSAWSLPPSTLACVVPASNQPSSVSRFFSYWSASSSSSSRGSSRSEDGRVGEGGVGR